MRYFRYGTLDVDFGWIAGIPVMWPIFCSIDADDLQGFFYYWDYYWLALLFFLGLLLIGSFFIGIIIVYLSIIIVTLQTVVPSPIRGSRGYAYTCPLLTRGALIRKIIACITECIVLARAVLVITERRSQPRCGRTKPHLSASPAQTMSQQQKKKNKKTKKALPSIRSGKEDEVANLNGTSPL